MEDSPESYSIVIRSDCKRETLETVSLDDAFHYSHMHLPSFVSAPALGIRRPDEIFGNVVVAECLSQASRGRFGVPAGNSANSMLLGRAA